MTSVPKPLKFLKHHYEGLKVHFKSLSAGSENKADLADIISVLAMTSAPENANETLQYKLLAGTADISLWGHEYIRRLAGEISTEYEKRASAEEAASLDDLMALVSQIVPWDMTHNAEPEAVDLCIEVERLDLLLSMVDANNCTRTCLYLLACASYLPEPDNLSVMRTAYDAYMKVGRWTDALRISLRMGDSVLASQVVAAASDPSEKKQLAFMLGEARVWIDLEEGPASVEDEELREQLVANMG